MILNNKTIIQTKVTSGINANVLPIKNTNINSNSASTNSINELHELLKNQATPCINSFMNSNFEKRCYPTLRLTYR